MTKSIRPITMLESIYGKLRFAVVGSTFLFIQGPAFGDMYTYNLQRVSVLYVSTWEVANDSIVRHYALRVGTDTSKVHLISYFQDKSVSPLQNVELLDKLSIGLSGLQKPYLYLQCYEPAYETGSNPKHVYYNISNNTVRFPTAKCILSSVGAWR